MATWIQSCVLQRRWERQHSFFNLTLSLPARRKIPSGFFTKIHPTLPNWFLFFFPGEWGKWEERIQHCSAWTVIFSEKLFYLIKHSIFKSKTVCGNIPVQSQRYPSIHRKEINFLRRWIITLSDKGQVPVGNLYAAMLSATVVDGLVPVPGVEQHQELHLHHWLRHICFACTECTVWTQGAGDAEEVGVRH